MVGAVRSLVRHKLSMMHYVMMHWVVRTCCYAPGLLLMAEQWRRAASRKKVTTVHVDEFTKTTDKRNDKQSLLKEGGTLADAYSSLIVLLQFGRTTCGDIEAKMWSLFASPMMAMCAVRLCYYTVWIGEEVTDASCRGPRCYDGRVHDLRAVRRR